MSKVLVTESYLSDIADAIRSKNGLSATYTPGQMASAIQNIPSQGGGSAPYGTQEITFTNIRASTQVTVWTNVETFVLTPQHSHTITVPLTQQDSDGRQDYTVMFMTSAKCSITLTPYNPTIKYEGVGTTNNETFCVFTGQKTPGVGARVTDISLGDG